MKLLELYSLSTGQEIGIPYITQLLYPLPFDNYITIHASSGMESKNYKYWNDVLDMIRSKSSKLNIVQIGGKDDIRLNGCFDLCGKLNINQSAYVVSNSKFHLSNDTWTAHLAGHELIPQICIYGPTTVKNHSPYSYHNVLSHFIESHRNGKKPSYSSRESVRTIDMIKPEEIANAYLNSNCGIESVFFGESYPEIGYEYVPNFKCDFSKIPSDIINVRMDYEHNEQFLIDALSVKQCNICFENEININIFRRMKKNIIQLSVCIDNMSDEYVNSLKSHGIKMNVFSKRKDNINEIRLKFFDLIINLDVPVEKPRINVDSSAFFKTNKFILSRGKVYPSYAHEKRDITSNTREFNVIDDSDFWRDSEFFYIYNKK